MFFTPPAPVPPISTIFFQYYCWVSLDPQNRGGNGSQTIQSNKKNCEPQEGRIVFERLHVNFGAAPLTTAPPPGPQPLALPGK